MGTGTQSPARGVVVGVDGSAHSGVALAWAAQAANQHRWPLRIVHAFTWPAYAASYGLPPAAWESDELLKHADDLVAEAVAEARSLAPDRAVEGAVTPGSAAAVLIHESHRAGLTVVGRRGAGGFTDLLLGSVSAQVARHASGAVVVVPLEYTTGNGRILVGVDGSPGADAALGFAYQEAQASGATVVPVWAGEGAERLATALERWRITYPDVPVLPRTVSGSAADELLRASGDADLLVVGSRGHGGFHQLMLGSTSSTVLHHATCPVAVVHQPARHP